MFAILESTPDIYLDELAERIMEQHDINVSLSTISRTLKALGVTSKKVFCFLYYLGFTYQIISSLVRLLKDVKTRG